MKEPPKKVLICINRRLKADEASCAARGSLEIAEAMERGIKERSIDIVFERFVCFGHCTKGPNVKLAPGAFVHGVTPDMVDGILDQLQDACGTRDDEEPDPPLHLLGS